MDWVLLASLITSFWRSLMLPYNEQASKGLSVPVEQCRVSFNWETKWTNHSQLQQKPKIQRIRSFAAQFSRVRQALPLTRTWLMAWRGNSNPMPLILILVILVLFFGGGGYYMGPGVGYYGGGGLSLVLALVILYLLFGRGRSRLWSPNASHSRQYLYANFIDEENRSSME